MVCSSRNGAAAHFNLPAGWRGGGTVVLDLVGFVKFFYWGCGG